ncbi:VCBS repeat domain-containing M23 family metallopeptidase [Micromonospora sp. NBC_01655]|uniref:VCBS repeat domain-containing M23 family metallopeptidase n=1 Tax=Micromonospora sp. NBC_01655 TaxID=2975983 RepID=UPI002B1CD499|nr:VCBS repeat domain-containing M23 family metallopeptidase [Micromonospora sp. NBC_01655]
MPRHPRTVRRSLVALVTLAAAVLTGVVAAPTAALAAPNFKAPFPCGQRWTYDHHSAEVRQALDFVRADGGTTGGTPQVASAAGVARRYSQPSGAGNYVVIDHGGGWTTYYFHLSAYSVPDGAYVEQGQQIGVTGSTGNSSGPHVHYEQLYNGVGQTIVINGVSLAPYPGQYNQKYLVSDNCGGGGGGGRYLAGSPTDFSGDGKDDIVAFTQGSLNDVYVATSTGSSFTGTSVKWNDFFGLNGETLTTGDVNGDGKDDIIAFTHGSLADVYVALSTGTSFAPATKWHDWFAPGAEVATTGDVNGDGKDDIITFTHDNTADVYVALSTGTSFTGTAIKWHDYFSIPGEHPATGDVNGDGKDDIITFTQGPTTASDVIIALSNGTTFGTPQKWHDLFAVGTEQPRVGDINGDGKDDIVTFTCNTDADVYAATSTGTTFTGTTIKWHDHFCLTGEFPYLADANGDGKDDIIVFTKGTTNDVHVALSTGTTFSTPQKWHDFFGLPQETTL